MIIGFDKPLYILPFDHRGSFQKRMFGWDGPLLPEQTAQVSAAKQAIYDGFTVAVASGVPSEKAGILVDEQFGSAFGASAPLKELQRKFGFETDLVVEPARQLLGK